MTPLGDTGLKATTFLYNLQQPTKGIDENLNPYDNILNAIEIEEEMVINKYAKAVVRRKLERFQLKSENEQPLTSTRSEINTISLENKSKFKTQDNEEEDEFNDAKDNLFTSPTTRESSNVLRSNKTSKVVAPDERLKKLSRKGPAAYGSVKSLQKASKLPEKTVQKFLTHTKLLYKEQNLP